MIQLAIKDSRCRVYVIAIPIDQLFFQPYMANMYGAFVFCRVPLYNSIPFFNVRNNVTDTWNPAYR